MLICAACDKSLPTKPLLYTPIIQEITLRFRRCPCRWHGIYPIIRF